MEITKTMVENWLEAYLSENPNADSFDLTMAAMQYGLKLGATPDKGEHFCDHDYDLNGQDKSLNDWFNEQPFDVLKKLTGRDYTEFDSEDGYQAYVDFCEDWWNGLSRKEKTRVLNQIAGETGYVCANDRVITDTVFGDVSLESGSIIIINGDSDCYYHLPRRGMTDDEIREFCKELYEFEK